jgi:hypothetical protein
MNTHVRTHDCTRLGSGHHTFWLPVFRSSKDPGPVFEDLVLDPDIVQDDGWISFSVQDSRGTSTRVRGWTHDPERALRLIRDDPAGQWQPNYRFLWICREDSRTPISLNPDEPTPCQIPGNCQRPYARPDLRHPSGRRKLATHRLGDLNNKDS